MRPGRRFPRVVATHAPPHFRHELRGDHGAALLPGPALYGLLYAVADEAGDSFQPFQGSWFLSGTIGSSPEDPHLALVHSNIHPDRAVFSIGISVPGIDSGAYEFLPRGQGLLNRDFPDNTADGRVYGFQVAWFEGIIIVMMHDAETLWIEALKGAGTGPTSWAFSQNKTVFVR